MRPDFLLRFLVCLVALVLTPILYTGCKIGDDPEPSSQIWFDDLQGHAEISEEDRNQLVRSVGDSILNFRTRVEDVPSSLAKDESPRIVFISISDNSSPAMTSIGMGKGITEAIEGALSKLQKARPEGYSPKLVKLDLVSRVYPVERVSPYTKLNYDRSLYGIAFERGRQIAFLPEEIIANSLVDSDQRLKISNISKYLERQPGYANAVSQLGGTESFQIIPFTLDSYSYYDGSAYRLYRGHRLFNETSSDLLLQTARLGGDYLTRSVQQDGSFIYVYDPVTDSTPDGYNILRHAGTAYAMLELYEFTRDEALLKASKRAIDYLIRSIQPCTAGAEVLACVVEDGYVKLGGNALGIVALSKYAEVTDDSQYVPVLTKLAKWIQKSQRKDGEFFPHKESYPGGKPTRFVSQYYPGEAILALTRMYELNGDKSYLDTAEEGAQYLINVRDKGLPISELNHDHWLLYALNELYRHRQNPSYLDHSMRIAQAIVRSQNRDPKYPDWFGSYDDPPRSTPTATRSEGLSAAYQLARDFGDPDEANQILESLKNGIRFQLQTQFLPESAMYLKDPERPVGGFHSSLVEFEIRNDYVQHNISSILGLYRIQAEMQKAKDLTDQTRSEVNELKILFAGDTSFGENYQSEIEKRGKESVLRKEGYGHSLQGLKPLLSHSDLVIANLETPITNLGESPLSGVKNYVHWADRVKTPKYLRDYNIRTVSLANNHALDYGINGLRQTVDDLARHDIEWFGAGFTEREAEKPFTKKYRIGDSTFTLAVIGAFEYRDNYDRDFNYYADGEAGGVNRLSAERIAEQIGKIRNANPETYIVVFPHWGENYMWKSKGQTELAHKIIEAGADVIIGHGAHKMQEIESYRGHWIVYNLGNFMFNSQGRYDRYKVEPFSMAVQLILAENGGAIEKQLKIYPIYTNNLTTNYQSRLLMKSEFDEAYSLLLKKSRIPSQAAKEVTTGSDDIGFYLELPL